MHLILLQARSIVMLSSSDDRGGGGAAVGDLTSPFIPSEAVSLHKRAGFIIMATFSAAPCVTRRHLFTRTLP